MNNLDIAVWSVSQRCKKQVWISIFVFIFFYPQIFIVSFRNIDFLLIGTKDARCQALFICQKFDIYWQILFNLACLRWGPLRLVDSFFIISLGLYFLFSFLSSPFLSWTLTSQQHQSIGRARASVTWSLACRAHFFRLRLLVTLSLREK